MQTTTVLRPGDVVTCPKAPGVRHEGLVMPFGIFHNSPESGECLVSLEKFCSGRPYTVSRTANAAVRSMAVSRAWQMLQNPRPWHLVEWNCQHSVSYALTGQGRSDKVRTAGMVLLAGGVLYCLSQAQGSGRA